MPITKIEKNELLRQCWQVFNRHGYSATSMSKLAEATGLGKSGLLHHYSSKEELMQAVLTYAKDFFQSYVLDVSKEDLPDEQRLEKMLRRQKRLATIERRGCFFANTAVEMGREELFNKIITKAFEDWQAAFVSILEKYMDKEKANERAYRLIMEYEGAVTFYKFSDDIAHIERFIQRSLKDIFPNYVFIR